MCEKICEKYSSKVAVACAVLYNFPSPSLRSCERKSFSLSRTLKHNTNTQDCKAGRVRAPACHVEKTNKGQGAYLEKETDRQQREKYECRGESFFSPFLKASCFFFFFFKALSCAFLILFLSSESLANSSASYSFTASQPASLLSASFMIF